MWWKEVFIVIWLILIALGTPMGLFACGMALHNRKLHLKEERAVLAFAVGLMLISLSITLAVLGPFFIS